MTPAAIRIATPEDAAALLAIYAPYVEKTAITFEYDVPSWEEFRTRIIRTLQRYPYLVAEENGIAVGYAYIGSFGTRPAYGWAAETSIYLRQDTQGRGLGKQLYAALEECAKAQHIQNLYACIAYPDVDDAYLTGNSVAFHTHLGYREAGRFCHCGYKFGTWYNMVWMEKQMGDHAVPPAPFLPFPDLIGK